MIAMALACEPDLVIADEPTTALDVTIQLQILNLFQGLKEKRRMSLLYISHDLGVISQVSDKIAVMYKGEIVETGSRDKIFNKPSHPYTRGLIACRPPLNERPERLVTIDEFVSGNITGNDILNNNGTGVQEIKNREKEHERLYASKPLLKVENLEKRYPLKKPFFGRVKEYVRAVDNVSLDVYPGETLGLVGESGCGKTTLGRSILRLIEPDGGKIFFDEKDLVGLSRKSFLGEILDLPTTERLVGTIAANAIAIANGADIIRVHDVKEGRRTADVAFRLRNDAA